MGRLVGEMGLEGGLVGGPAPPRALTLDPLSISPWEGEGEKFAGEGMIVVDDGVAAVMGGGGVAMVGGCLVGRPSSFTSFQILHILVQKPHVVPAQAGTQRGRVLRPNSIVAECDAASATFVRHGEFPQERPTDQSDEGTHTW